MPTDDTVLALGAEPFVSLTTFRRSGEGVATPVWIARDGDTLVAFTPAGTGKVTRLRRDSTAHLRPCDRRGRVASDAPTIRVRAQVDDDPSAVWRVTDLLRRKYGFEFRAVVAIERLARRGHRSRVALVMRADEGTHLRASS